jgi:Zn-dependent protease
MGPLMAMLFGSVPIGTWFGIRVRLHASLIIFIGLTLVLGPGASQNFDIIDALTSMVILFFTVLLHEFGHCFAARYMGGEADDIVMTPIGGLAYATPPHRPWPTFVTVACGPLVNVGICLLTGSALYLSAGAIVPVNPFELNLALHPYSIEFYLWWIYYINYVILLFNLLPIYPLDGGQMLHAILWPHLGYYKATSFSCVTGMVGAVIVAFYGLAMGQLLLIALAVSGFITCYQRRMQLKEMGPEGLHDAIDYSASLRAADEEDRPKRRRLSNRALKRIRKKALKEQQELAKIDAILEKVGKHGMHSLTWWEKRTLRKATERQRQRDLELAKSYRA